MIRQEQCDKVCRILDDVLANRPTERDSLIIAVRKAFESLEQFGNSEQLPSARPEKRTENTRKTHGVCLDTISRRQAIEPEAISKWKKEFREYVDSLDIARDDWKGIIEYIDELPSVQPERKTGRWIPVSERLPDKRGDYLVTLCGNGEPWVEIALWNETFGGRWQAVLYNDVDYSDISNVIAWMSLPEAYREGGE